MSQTCWENQFESVKARRFQAPQIRDALLELEEISEDRILSPEKSFRINYFIYIVDQAISIINE